MAVYGIVLTASFAILRIDARRIREQSGVASRGTIFGWSYDAMTAVYGIVYSLYQLPPELCLSPFPCMEVRDIWRAAREGNISAG